MQCTVTLCDGLAQGFLAINPRRCPNQATVGPYCEEHRSFYHEPESE